METLNVVFLWFFNYSLIGGAAILVTLVGHLMLHRAPKKYSYLLWAGPALLLAGASMEGFFSSRSFDLRLMAGQSITGVTFTGAPDSVFRAVEASIPALAQQPYNSVNPIQLVTLALANLWLAGVATMLVYSLWTTVRLWLQLHGASHLGEGVYLAYSIRTPFVMGVFRPRIYLPAGLAEEERNYILLHERTHISRGDHIIKPLAYLLLCMHWFNPLCWLAFYLMSRDMEMSCDEAVVKKLGSDIKQPYAGSLLALAAPRSIWGGSTLAFGEGHAGRRINNLLRYKKPARWVTVLSVVVAGWLMLGMVSNRPYSEGGYISQMYACRTENVERQGEAIHKLARLAPPIERMEFKGSRLEETERGGYSATVLYIYHINNPEQMSPPPISESAINELRRNAVILMSLTREVETVYMTYSHNVQGSGEAARVVTRDEATRLLDGIDPWEYSSSLQKFEQLYGLLRQ